MINMILITVAMPLIYHWLHMILRILVIIQVHITLYRMINNTL